MHDAADAMPAAGQADGHTSRPIKLGALEDFIGFKLRLAQDTSFAVFSRQVGSHRVRPGNFASLAVIGENPGLTQAALGQAIARDKSSVTPLVKGLEQDGLIERRPSATDRRSVTLWLTEDGARALISLKRHAEEHERKLDRIIGSKNKPEMLRLLQKIITELN